jgi:hypothetical protein
MGKTAKNDTEGVSNTSSETSIFSHIYDWVLYLVKIPFWFFIVVTIVSIALTFLTTKHHKPPPLPLSCPHFTPQPLNSTKIFLEVKFIKCPITTNDNFEFEVTVFNGDDRIDYQESMLFFRDPSEHLFYNNKSKLPWMATLNSGHTFNITLKTRKVTSFVHIPEFFYITIRQGKEEIVYVVHVKLQWFATFLNPDYLKEKVGCILDYVQVLLYGIAGAGKSTHINTQFSSISDNIRSVVAHRRSEGHQTKKIAPFLLFHDYDKIPYKHMVFYDPYGVSVDNFAKEILERLLEGILPPSFTILNSTRAVKDFKRGRKAFTIDQRERSHKKRIKQRMHAIVFVVTLESIYDTKSELSARMKIAYDVAISLQYNPIILISHLPLSTSAEEIANITMNVSQRTGIDVMDILPTFAYIETGEKQFEIDKNAAIIREKIMYRAIDSITSSIGGITSLRQYMYDGCPKDLKETVHDIWEGFERNFFSTKKWYLNIRFLIRLFGGF